MNMHVMQSGNYEGQLSYESFNAESNENKTNGLYIINKLLLNGTPCSGLCA